MSFSSNLKVLREEKGISQKELANMTGVSQTAVYHWEKGVRSPKIEQLQKIALALEIPISKLIDQETLNLTDDVIALFSNDSPQDLGNTLPNTPQENYLMIKFRELNDKGRNKVVDYADDLSKTKEYTENEEE